MTDQPKPCRTTQHCAVHGFCHRCTPSLDEATQHLVKAIDAAGITTGTGRVYAALAATVRDAARTASGQQPERTCNCRFDPAAEKNHRPWCAVWPHSAGQTAVGQPAEAPTADRAAVLDEAADAVAAYTGNPIDANAQMLRRMAEEARS